MKRAVLVVDPDARLRDLADRALTAAGFTAEPFERCADARILLDESAFDVAVVDALDAGGTYLDGVRFLRARYPRLPVVVTGTSLDADTLLALLRAGVRDVVRKPYSPAELRDAVARASASSLADHDRALDYAAALGIATAALDAGRTDEARAALARARALSPLDPEVTAFDARCAELAGRDDDAARGYGAALALARDGDAGAELAREGLARIDARRTR